MGLPFAHLISNVESSRLTAFYRAVPRWPKTKAESDAMVEELRFLLDAPGAAACIPGAGPAFSGVIGIDEKLLNGRQADTMDVRRVQLEEGAPRTADGAVLSQMLIAPVIGQFSGEPGAVSRLSQDRHGCGWIAVFSARGLNGKSELLLLSAAQHLADLAVLAQAEKGLVQRDQFLSIASHELKTPLTSIYGILQLQERMCRPDQAGKLKLPDPQKQLSFLHISIRQVERLGELIDGLLDVSRIQNGRFNVEPSDTDIASLLEETVTTRLRVIAEEAGVKIEVEHPDRLMACVDPVRFEEVITNLGMNAIRFSPEGGFVVMKLREEEGHIRLIVRDQGVTVPEVDRERIFQPFERAQHTARLGGLGLGLFISRQIAQLHGGNVTLVPSGPDRGNSFEAVFPRRRVLRRIA